MPNDFDVVALTLCGMILFSAGWVARGIADALEKMLGAAWTYFKERTAND